MPFAHDQRQMLEGLDVRLAEQFMQVVVQGFVKGVVAVQRGVHEGDAVAHRVGAIALRLDPRVAVEGFVVEAVEPVFLAVGVSGHRFDADRIEHPRQVQTGLQPGGRGDHGVSGNLRADHRTHALQPRQQRHEERRRAVAMHHALHVFGLGLLLNLRDGSLEVVLGDLVAVPFLLARRQQNAYPEIQQPHVIVVLAQVLQQVGLDGVGGKDIRTDTQAMHQHHRAFAAGLITGQAQFDAVLGGEEMHRRGWRIQRPFQAWRRVGVEVFVTGKHPAVTLPENPGEELAEARQAFDALTLVTRVEHFHGGHLLGEIGRMNVHHPGADHLARLVRPAIQRHVQGAGVVPDIQHAVVFRHGFEGAEVIVGAVLGGQFHVVFHVPRVDLLLELLEQVEHAIAGGQRLRRQRRGVDRADDGRGMLRLLDHPVEVVGGDGQGEVDGRVVRLAAFGRRFVDFQIGALCGGESAGEIALHGFGELHAEGRRGHLFARCRGQCVVDVPTPVSGEQAHVALAHGGDGQQRIDRQRGRDHRAVRHVKTGVDIGAGRAAEHLALVIDHALRRVFAHHATAQRMHRDDAVLEQLGPDRVLDPDPAQCLGALVQPFVAELEVFLLADARPVDAQLVLVVEQHPALATVVAHDQVGLHVVQRAVIRAAQEAFGLALLVAKLAAETVVGGLADHLGKPGHRRHHWPAERAGD